MFGRLKLSLIGSFLLATVVWASVTLNNTYIARFIVPLEVANLPADMALAKPLPETIEISLEGSGWQLIMLSSGGRLVFAIPGHRLSSGQTIIASRIMNESLNLPAGVRGVQAWPDTIRVSLDQYTQKTVPLRFEYTVLEFRRDFGLSGQVSLKPDSILLMGAEKVLRNVHSWPVARRAWKDLSLPVVDEVAVQDSLPGIIKFRAETARLYIPVEQLADVSFDEIPVQVTDVPEGRSVLLANPVITVYVRGGINRLATMDASDFKVQIPYAAFLQDTSGAVLPSVHVPEGLTLLKTAPASIRYTIRR